MINLEPDTIVWETTLRCNSRCIHCGSRAYKERKDELTTQESFGLIRQIAELGFRRIIQSGGEPTLRDDWYKIACQIRNSGAGLGIISNALEWDEKTIDCLVSVSPFYVGLSVDGEEKMHDYLRGVGGSHRKVFDAVRSLKKRKQKICAITTVNSLNITELPLIRNRLVVYGLDAWQIQTATPMGNMERRKNLVLSDKQYYHLAEFVAETRERLGHMNIATADCIGYFGSLDSRLRDFEWGGCMAGIKALGIDSDGTIRACSSIRSDKAVAGNIRRRTLRDIWEDPLSFSFNRNFSLKDLRGKCQGCDYGEKCRGGCQSQSVAFYKEFHNAPYCLHNIESCDISP